MKKIFCWILILGLVINLCACSGAGNDSKQKYNLEDENNDNLEDAINQAQAAASYFYFDNRDDSYYDKNIYMKGNRDNEIWYKITDQRFNNLDNAKKFLGEYFSEELVDQIIAQAFRNEYLRLKKGDNELYILANTRDKDFSKVESNIKQKSDNKIIYDIDVKYFSPIDDDDDDDAVFETGNYSFVREKINDKWLFTKFSYVW